MSTEAFPIHLKYVFDEKKHLIQSYILTISKKAADEDSTRKFPQFMFPGVK